MLTVRSSQAGHVYYTRPRERTFSSFDPADTLINRESDKAASRVLTLLYFAALPLARLEPLLYGFTLKPYGFTLLYLYAIKMCF